MFRTEKKVRTICQTALIAALYVVLTYVSFFFGLASGAIQIRVSEALCVLPVFLPAAVPGLFLGCFIANLLMGNIIVDVIFGSIATLLAAIFTRIWRTHRFLSLLPPIFLNTAIIPWILKYAYGVEQGIIFLIFTVFVGELISSGLLGSFLLITFQRNKSFRKIFFRE